MCIFFKYKNIYILYINYIMKKICFYHYHVNGDSYISRIIVKHIVEHTKYLNLEYFYTAYRSLSSFCFDIIDDNNFNKINLYNKNKKRKEDPLDYHENDKEVSGDFIIDLQNSEILKKIYKLAEAHEDKRVKKILDMRYGSDYNKLIPWKNIAKKLRMSIQGCINIHNKFIEQTKKELENV